MTEEPDGIIEEYLTLINEHLPESISEEVITELRTYMVETARDLGGGEITLQSAKKVVAQFGAPSEVAEEYRYSMLPETIPAVHETSEDESTQKDRDDSGIEQKKPEIRKDPTASLSEAFLQATSIALTWSFLVVLASTLIGPIWIYTNTSMIFLTQIILVECCIAVLIFHRRNQKAILWKRTYPEWSITQRFFTLPENVFKNASDFLHAIDLLGALAGVVIFFLSAFLSPSSYYIPLVAVPCSMTLIAKSFYSGKRISSQNPTMTIRAEFAATFLALLLINSSQIWIMSYSFAVVLMFRIYSVIWGSVLLLQLVARAGDLWWDIDILETTLTTIEKSSLLHQTISTIKSLFLRLIGWITLFSVIPTYCLTISANIHTLWFSPILIAFFFGPIILSPIILYFLYRRWGLKAEKSTSVIGERSRAEAMGDFFLLAFILFQIGNNILILSPPYYISEQYHYVLSDFGYSGAQFFLLGFVSSNLLLFIGLVARVLADCLEFRTNRENASEMMIVSGIVLITSFTLRAGIDILSHDYLLFPFTYYPVILFLAMVIAFQVETSRLKIREQKNSSSTALDEMHGTERSNGEVRHNTQGSERKNRYLGN